VAPGLAQVPVHNGGVPSCQEMVVDAPRPPPSRASAHVKKKMYVVKV
jgi:hypothetical protein